MTGAAQVTDLGGYLAFLKVRLESEGFAVTRAANLGVFPVALLATRKGGTLAESDSITILVSNQEELGPRGFERVTADALLPFCVAAFDAQAQPSARSFGLLRGRTYILPVVVAQAGIDRRLADALSALHLRRGHCLGLPAIIDLDQGEVHLLRRSEDLGAAGVRLLPYLWWLLSPRLLDRPRTSTRGGPLRRIGLAVALLAALLFAGAYLYIDAQPSVRRYLFHAADAAHAQLAYARYGPGLGTIDLVVLDQDGRETSRRGMRGDAMLCALSGDVVLYKVCAQNDAAAPCTVWRDRTTTSASKAMLEVPRASACPQLSADGRRVLFSGDPRHPLQIHDDRGGTTDVAGAQPEDRAPSWFPDGNRIVVSTGPEGHQRVTVIDLATGVRRDLTAAAQDVRPMVSPDARLVAFYRVTRRAYGEHDTWRDTSAVGDLSIVPVEGGSERLLIQDVCFSSPPGWLGPRRLLYARWTGKRCDLFAYDLDRESTTQLGERR